ncbi:MAG: DNA-directed RNA polymerase subunit alpha C-terminal domain-containing protein [Chloroflexota bacterium]|nr:DNA-directed RNA polymerase subunit alpha C-terminal domain-containing protein [Anaerolineales bacterium]
MEQQKVKEELKGSPERPIDELGVTPRAIEALKAAGIENFGQFLEKLNGGNDAVLAIQGFGQTSLTAAKKKLRSLGYEIPAAAA